MILSTVISTICVRAGIPAVQLDTTLLPVVDVPGFLITNQYPAVQGIAALSQIYNFDWVNVDGVLRFVPRGGASVASVVEDDMVDDEQDVEQETKRFDQLSIPRMINFEYYAAGVGSLTPSKQTSERFGDRRAVGEVSVQSPVLLSDDNAAQAVVIIHKVMIESARGELRFALSDDFIFLTVTDIIAVTINGRTLRAMLSQVDVLDGYQQYTAVMDRQSAYVSSITGLATDTPLVPPAQTPGDSLLALLDIPLLRDADDGAGMGFYIAVSGQTAAWGGCLVEMSRDGGANYLDSQSATVKTVMGVLTDPLGDHDAAYPDEDNALGIQLLTPDASLDSATLASMLNRANLAAIGSPSTGWELINFGTAVEDDPTYQYWTLTTLLRGRKGSTARAHSAGEQFVLLTRSTLAFIPGSIADIGATLTFRATSYGRPTSEGVIDSMVFAGRTQVERAPAYLYADRVSTNIVATWQGVARLGGGVMVAHGQRFVGYSVTFSDGASDIVVETEDEELTQDVSSLGAPITVSVAQRNELTGLGPTIEVVVA